MASSQGNAQGQVGVGLPRVMGVKAPELLCRPPGRISSDIFECREIATGNNCARIAVLVVRSEGRSMS